MKTNALVNGQGVISGKANAKKSQLGTYLILVGVAAAFTLLVLAVITWGTI